MTGEGVYHVPGADPAPLVGLAGLLRLRLRVRDRGRAVTPDLGWHAMECGLCPETWWIPFGVTEYGTQEIERAAVHWRGHRDRGEDPRFEALKVERAGGAR